jgi:hypothetical protein
MMNDIVPPWVEFPTYERYSMGWRMGSGEGYMGEWSVFLEGLPDYASRLNYLQRHRPAPLNWCGTVEQVLDPESDREFGYEYSEAQILEFLNLKLIDYDAAYSTWLMQQETIAFPWKDGDDPIETARYWTRDFWFFSRQLNAARVQAFEMPEIPQPWQRFESQILTGQLGPVEAQQGLLTLAQMFCAGSVLPPWELGLKVEDVEDSFELEMGYADAYRLWIMSSFDDDRMLRQLLSDVPSAWEAWIEEQMMF